MIADFRRHLEEDTGLAAKTVAAYVADVEVWAAWAGRQGIAGPDQVTAQDVREYRDARERGAGKAVATANRRLTSLALLLDHAGRTGDANPARRVDHLEDVEHDDGRALTRNEWNAVRRQADLAGPLAEALAALLRYAGPRVGEIAPDAAGDQVPLLLGDLKLGSRSGELRIRRGKGRKQRSVPLVVEAREPLERYIYGERRQRLDAWSRRRGWTEAQRAWWENDQAPVFIGERGPLTIRGIRHLVAGLGERARLEYPLGPHDLRATFITALLDPAKYGLVREAVPITVVARLAGHADISTTARYARPAQDDLLRWMQGDQAAGD